MKNIIRYALILLGALSLLFICLLLIIKLFFPAQELKRIAENQFEKILNKTVNIEMIQFNPLSGIELTNIFISDEDTLLLSIKKISLLYNFKQLLRRKLVIDQIRIDKPRINLKHTQNQWNVPLITSGVQLKDDAKPAVIKKTEITALPLDIELKALNINDLFLSLNYDNNITAKFSGINLFLTGRLSSKLYNVNAKITGSPESTLFFRQAFPKKIKFHSVINSQLNITFQKLNTIPIKGDVKFENLSAFYQDRVALNDLSISLDLLLNMVEGKIKLNRINLDSNDYFNFNMSGEISQISEHPRLNLTLTDSFINLKETNQHISTLIPASITEGYLRIKNMRLAGSLQNENMLDADIQGLFSFDNIDIIHSKPNLSLKNSSGTIKVNKLNLKKNFPDKFDIEVELHLKNLISKTVSLTGLQKNIHFFSSEKADDEQIMNFIMNVEEVKLNIEKQHPVAFPFKANGSLTGNAANLDIKKLITEWNLLGAAAGKITGTYLASTHKKFEISNFVSFEIEAISKHIPGFYLKKMNELKLSGNISSKVNLSGQLNSQYLPEKIEFKIINNLRNISANFQPHYMVLTGLNAVSSADGRYSKKEGIDMPVIKFDGDFSNFRYSNQINLVESKYSLEAKNIGPLNFKNLAEINIDISGKVKSKLAESYPHQIKLNKLKMNVVFNAITSKEKLLNNIKLAGKIFTKKFQVGNKLISDNAKLAFNVYSPSIYSDNSKIDLNLSTPSLNIYYKNEAGFKNGLSARFLLLPDTQKKSIVIKKMDIDALPLFRASLYKAKFNFEKKFKIEDFKIFLDMKQLWESIPYSYHSKIPVQNPSGTIHISTNAEGIVPSKININEFDLPFKFNSILNIDKMTLELKQHNLKINNLNSKTNINNTGPRAINLSGTTSIGSMVNDFRSILPKLSDIYFHYDYSVKDLNSFSINKSIFKIDKGAISYSLEGLIEGFNPMLTQNVPISALEILNKIKLKLNSRLYLKKKGKLFIKSPVNFTGGLNAGFFIRLIPEKIISLKGHIGLKNITLKKEDFLINNITGNIPINKSYLLINEKKINSTIKPPDKFIFQSGLFSGLRSYSRHKDLISIESIRAGKHSINSILLDLYLDNNLFSVEQFSFELEGGTVLGSVYLLPDDKGHKLYLKANFASIDLNKILIIKSRGKEKADSKVNGNADLIIAVTPETGTTGFRLEQIEMSLNITHIGDNALDQLLIFFDPKESNPSIANVKDKLRFAKPSRLNIKLKNGRLSMFIRLTTHLAKSGYLNIQVLNRVPVQRVKQFSLITENLKGASAFFKIIKIWVSNHIGYNNNQFVLR